MSVSQARCQQTLLDGEPEFEAYSELLAAPRAAGEARLLESMEQERLMEALRQSVDDPLERLVADGMYDNATVYDALAAHQGGAAIDMVVPPRRNTAPLPTAQSAPTQRDQHIADIQSEGVLEWRRASGYYDQAHVENTFHRYKAIIGG